MEENRSPFFFHFGPNKLLTAQKMISISTRVTVNVILLKCYDNKRRSRRQYKREINLYHFPRLLIITIKTPSARAAIRVIKARGRRYKVFSIIPDMISPSPSQPTKPSTPREFATAKILAPLSPTI